MPGFWESSSPILTIEYESAKANLVNFGASSLDILVNIRLKVADYLEELQVKQAFLLEVIRLAEEMEVGFAFPSTSPLSGVHSRETVLGREVLHFAVEGTDREVRSEWLAGSNKRQWRVSRFSLRSGPQPTSDELEKRLCGIDVKPVAGSFDHL